MGGGVEKKMEATLGFRVWSRGVGEVDTLLKGLGSGLGQKGTIGFPVWSKESAGREYGQYRYSSRRV